jgi:hypothetical protein
MHRLSASFVLGYHGCDRAVAAKLVAGEPFRNSNNDFDWLGPGVYFWESNPHRGLEFAQEQKRRKNGPTITRPAVVGAVIDMGLCLDLTTSAGIRQVRSAHAQLHDILAAAELPLPTNSGDLLRRNLDCAVIRTLHEVREQGGEPPVDTVRGVFVEGAPVFDTSGFHDKTHIQICVRNLDCIKGVFRVSARDLD